MSFHHQSQLGSSTLLQRRISLMKLATRTLTLVAVLCLFGSLASAKPIRGKFEGATRRGVDANGSIASNSNGTILIKGIKFPKSGIIINRVKTPGVLNLSGMRQVFRNVAPHLIFDPEINAFLFPFPSRTRYVYPKGRTKKMNMVTGRALSVLNPNKPPLQLP